MKQRRPIPKKRFKPRIKRDRCPKVGEKPQAVIRLTGDDLESLRELVWQRDGHHCVKCGKWVALNADDSFKKMDLAHIKSRGAGGSDTADNTYCSCHCCHIGKSHNAGGKPCPPKPKAEESEVPRG